MGEEEAEDWLTGRKQKSACQPTELRASKARSKSVLRLLLRWHEDCLKKGGQGDAKRGGKVHGTKEKGAWHELTRKKILVPVGGRGPDRGRRGRSHGDRRDPRTARVTTRSRVKRARSKEKQKRGGSRKARFVDPQGRKAIRKDAKGSSGGRQKKKEEGGASRPPEWVKSGSDSPHTAG